MLFCRIRSVSLTTKLRASWLVVVNNKSSLICIGHFNTEIGTAHAPYHVMGSVAATLFGIADLDQPHFVYSLALGLQLLCGCDDD